MRELGYTWEWQDDGVLKATTPRLEAVVVAPGTEIRCFFNQLPATTNNAIEFSRTFCSLQVQLAKCRHSHTHALDHATELMGFTCLRQESAWMVTDLRAGARVWTLTSLPKRGSTNAFHSVTALKFHSQLCCMQRSAKHKRELRLLSGTLCSFRLGSVWLSEKESKSEPLCPPPAGIMREARCGPAVARWYVIANNACYDPPSSLCS